MTAELDRIRSLHAGIEGPWEYEVGSGNIIAEFTTDDGHDAELIACAENSNVGAFIAAAPSTVTHLLAIIDKVCELHSKTVWKAGQPRPADTDDLCAWCGTAYPCATVEAITRESA